MLWQIMLEEVRSKGKRDPQRDAELSSRSGTTCVASSHCLGKAVHDLF